MEAKAKWHQRLSFTGSIDTGFSIPLDAETAVGGDGDGFRPIDLLVTGLAGCTAMDVISILQKKRQQITDFEVVVRAKRAETHPRIITHAVIEYHTTGNRVDEAAMVRAIELSSTRYCPAQNMFKGVFPMDLIYYIYEDQGEGGRELVTRGEYTLPVSS